MSAKLCWRKCYIRRLYSSSTVETSQPPRRAPIAHDLGGIQIGSARFSRQGRHSDSPLDLRDFKSGTLSAQLALRALQQKHQDSQSQILPKQNPVPSQSHPSQTDNTKVFHQKDGAYVQSRQQRGNVDMHKSRRYPAQQRARMQGRSHPVKHEFKSGERAELIEEEETDAIDDDVNATKTTLQLRRPDPPLTPRRPPLPPSLTMLEQKIYIDCPKHELLEQQGGDYVRYFSPDEWKIARAQSSAPLGVIDYARLALHLNRTVPVLQRREGVELIRKHVEKANPSTALP